MYKKFEHCALQLPYCVSSVVPSVFGANHLFLLSHFGFRFVDSELWVRPWGSVYRAPILRLPRFLISTRTFRLSAFDLLHSPWCVLFVCYVFLRTLCNLRFAAYNFCLPRFWFRITASQFRHMVARFFCDSPFFCSEYFYLCVPLCEIYFADVTFRRWVSTSRFCGLCSC